MDNYTKPEVVLASFPRSGNTYLRNVLLDVYDIFSWNNIEKFNQAQEKAEVLEERHKQRNQEGTPPERLKELRHELLFPVVKTHEIPGNILPLCSPDARIIYLMRDGRDALVSIAHHRKDIIAPGSDFLINLEQAILAREGSHFGGWSANVMEWIPLAHAVIHFEDLVEKPLETMEKLRGILDLPLPDRKNIPTFESQREGKSYFGGRARKQISDEEKQEFNQLFFRKGKIGGWKEEMPEQMHELFWKLHGKVSEEMGYLYDGSFDRSNW
ncbi:MAG: sulfotransferase domain-containing protein [Bacteroidetes bacterium]|nr:sulfotransferase domain-containing protein [Bacteroidota bacterium]